MSTFYGSPDLRSVHTGYESMPRVDCRSTGITMSTGSLRLAFFIADKSVSVTTMNCPSLSTAAGATPTLCRYGIYGVNESTQALTLLAAIASDTSIWAGTTTAYARALSTGGGLPASITLDRGSRYAFGAICVTAATAPTVHGDNATTLSANGPTSVIGTHGRFAAVLSAQSDLPASIADASLTTSGSRIFIEAY